MTPLHHAAIRVGDLEQSLRFWRDGIGLEVLMDHEFTGDWPTLFDAPSTWLRSVFLGQADHADAGIVELVDLGPPTDDASTTDSRVRPTQPPAGVLLLSFMLDVETTLVRLSSLGLGGDPRRVELGSVAMATVRDPDGVVVELIDARASGNLGSLTRDRKSTGGA
jgi:glyoxylase I family protein